MVSTVKSISAGPAGPEPPGGNGFLYKRAYRQLEAFFPYTPPQTLDAMATDRVQIVKDYLKQDFPRHQLPMLASLSVLFSTGIVKSYVSSSAAKAWSIAGLLGIFGSAAFRYVDVRTRTNRAIALSEFGKKYTSIINDPRANSPTGKIYRQLLAANPNVDPKQLMVQARQEALRQSVVTSRLNKVFILLTTLLTGFPFPIPVIRPISRKIYDHRNSQPKIVPNQVYPLS